MITICPSCTTKFNVHPEQLALANGLVRCGACMTVFNAEQHKNVTTKTRPQGPITDGEDTQNTPSQPPDHQPNSPGNDNKKHSALPPMYPENELIADEEPRTPKEEFSSSILDLPNNRIRDPFSYEVGTEEVDKLDEKGDQDESWAISLLEELESDESSAGELSDANEAPEPKPKIHIDQDSGRKEPTFSALFGKSKLEQDVADFFKESNYKKTHEPPPLVEKKRPRKKLLNELRDEPVALQHTTWQKKSRYFVGLLTFACLLAIVALQLVIYNMPTLAKYPNLHPYLEYLCKHLNCTVPSIRNSKQIKSLSISTTPHPEKTDRLIVNAIIFNLAENATPFPNLILKFTNNKGKRVADYIIPPVDYRRGDLLQFSTLPPAKSVHLKFEIKSPGPSATSYSLNFEYPPEYQ